MGTYSFKKYDGVEVKMTSIQELFDDATCAEIIKLLMPRQCHYNSFRIALMLSEKGIDVEYCEGYLYAPYPIEHCFNRIGDKYFDPLWEYYKGEKIYFLFRAFTLKEIGRVGLALGGESFITFRGLLRRKKGVPVLTVLTDDGELEDRPVEVQNKEKSSK